MSESAVACREDFSRVTLVIKRVTC
jgi:hypothetical protein